MQPVTAVGTRRSSRVKTPVIYDHKASDFLSEHYANFDADAVDKPNQDSSEECAATLYFDGEKVHGATGVAGHAEMNALATFAGNKREAFKSGADIFDGVTIAVDCPSKSCCKRCSAVLGALGAAAYNGSTTKCFVSMGSTEWGLPYELTAAVARHVGKKDPAAVAQATASLQNLGSV